MKIKRMSSFLCVFLISLIFTGCNVLNGTDAQIAFNGDTAPTLNNLVITSTDSYSITLQQPTLPTAGTPAPTVNAYIGVNGVITASGSSISGSIQGPIDVSSGSYQFSSLNSGTSYKIIVVAENYKGYSIKQITQSTAYIAPALNNLVINDSGSSSITLQHPTFSTAGNPTPTVNAYIGINGTITVNGSTVSNSIQGPIDVSSGYYQFTGLNLLTDYRIIVVAQNNQGYSVKQIVQSTAGISPVLNNLVVPNYDSSSITLQHPTFSIVGNPVPTVKAYIGINGTIAVSGSTVSNYIQGPLDVSSGDYQFTGLNLYTNYKIIVVAQNNQGYSVKQIIQSTAGIAPVLNSLVISNHDSSSITLQHPTFSTAGNPTPTVQAYVGVNGTISVSGSTVSNYIQGPIDVSSGDYQFTGLNSATGYEIIVVAENNQSYSVKQVTTVTLADKDITAFSVLGHTGVISGTSIAITVPYGTIVTGLVATFTTTGNSVTVGTTPQVSGITANDFTIPVTYIVTATDGLTKMYTVTVMVTPSLNIVWQKTFGGNLFNANSIKQTTDGGYVFAGWSRANYSGNHGGYDFWVVKLDSSGTEVWEQNLGGSGNELAYSIQQTTDGGYIVAGESDDATGNHGNTDYWIVKLDSSGNIIWQKSLGGSGGETAYSIQQTNDGGYIVAGTSTSTDGDVTGNHGNGDYWIVKLDSSGNIIWQKSLGGSGNDYAQSIQQTSDGGYIVAGTSTSNDGDVTGHHGAAGVPGVNGVSDYWIVKLDSSGNIIWQKSLGGSDDDIVTSIQQTTDGGYIVAGYSWSTDGDVTGNHGNGDYWIVKLDSSGNIIWQKSLGGSGNDYASSIQQTTDGGYIVAGTSWSNDGDVTGHHGAAGVTDYWIVKLDSSGNIIWQKSLGGSNTDGAHSIQQTTDGGYVVAGDSFSNDGDVTNGSSGGLVWVVKLL